MYKRQVPDLHAQGFLRKPAYGKIRKPADRIAVFPNEDFDWEQDMHPMLPYEDSTCYCLHVRGFTMHASSQVTHRGTFAGVVEKLDYLQELGVGAIWLSPFNDSPNYDNGYDVSDYYKVMEEAGTMEELEELIAACEKREIVVMMDLVLNHSSHLHPWFLEARKDRNSKYHDFYIWKEGTKEQPPEGGGAFFGGSTWEWVPEVQEYYYHSFSVMQPDLNWKNPSLRKELYRMIQFWMDKGIRGFRLDAIDNIVKDGHGGNDTHSEQIHTYLMEMNQNTYGKSEQILTAVSYTHLTLPTNSRV